MQARVLALALAPARSRNWLVLDVADNFWAHAGPPNGQRILCTALTVYAIFATNHYATRNEESGLDYAADNAPLGIAWTAILLSVSASIFFCCGCFCFDAIVFKMLPYNLVIGLIPSGYGLMAPNLKWHPCENGYISF